MGANILKTGQICNYIGAMLLFRIQLKNHPSLSVSYPLPVCRLFILCLKPAIKLSNVTSNVSTCYFILLPELIISSQVFWYIIYIYILLKSACTYLLLSSTFSFACKYSGFIGLLKERHFYRLWHCFVTTWPHD